jgi:hypothetical protein
MTSQVLLFLGALITCAWGISHLFPTKIVVHNFGELSADNENTITMEWIVEGISLIFIGILVAVVTLIDSTTFVSKAIFWVCASELVVLSIVSLFTGFKVHHIAFKLCPVMFSVSALLILIGSLI